MSKAEFDPGVEPYISLLTFRKSGAEVTTPVWVARQGACLYVFSEARAGKIKRIRNNPDIRIAACSYNGALKSGWLCGTAHIVTDNDEIASMYEAFQQKYGWTMRLTNFLSRLSGRYDKRAIIALTLACAGTESTTAS